MTSEIASATRPTGTRTPNPRAERKVPALRRIVVRATSVASLIASAILTAACAAPAVFPESSGSVSGAGTDPTRARLAHRAVEDALRAFTPPPDARPLPGRPPSLPARSANVVTDGAWYSIDGPLVSELDEVTKHLPTGFRQHSYAHGDGPQSIGESMVYDGPATDAYANLQVTVSATSDTGRETLRIEAAAVWRPARTPAEHAPMSPTGATVALSGMNTASRSVRVGAAEARLLAHMLNDLDGDAPLGGSCVSFPTYSIAFAGSDANFRTGPCASIAVTAAGAPQPTLDLYAPDGSSALLTELIRLVGPPYPGNPNAVIPTSG